MPSIKLSNRARNTPPSPIRSLAHLAYKAEAAGNRVYYMNIGQPDIPSPKEFFDGLRLFKKDIVAYERSQGHKELCEAWSQHFNREMDLATTPEQFLITMGASEALVFLCMTCCDPGDEIIIFDPTYANYIGFAAIGGVDLIPILSNFDEGFCLPPREKIEAAITNRTRAILLCNPNNPTGTVYTEDELRCLLNICDENNIFFIVDETYREFVYDGIKPRSVLQIAPNNKRVIIVDSLSKRYSLCGARIGCFITPNEEVLATTLNIAQARLAAPTLEQFAAAYMLRTIEGDYLEEVRLEYQRRRDTLFDALQQVPDVSAQKPGGAFYTVVKLPVVSASRFARFLLADFALENQTTFVAPGEGFYMLNSHGVKNIRMAYVINRTDIVKAIEVLAAGLETYRAREAS